MKTLKSEARIEVNGRREEDQGDKELEEAMRFIDELHRDPVKLEIWVDRVVEGWKKRASGRPLKIHPRRQL